MGGALAVRLAHSGSLPSLAGLMVIDVVEGMPCVRACICKCVLYL